jgi:hypothetical protein
LLCSNSAVAQPSPDAPPVIMATFPLISMVNSISVINLRAMISGEPTVQCLYRDKGG